LTWCCCQRLPQLPSGGLKGRDIRRRTSIIFAAAMVPLFPPLLPLLFPPLHPYPMHLPSPVPSHLPCRPPSYPPPPAPTPVPTPPPSPTTSSPQPSLPPSSSPPPFSPPGARETLLKSMGRHLLGLFCQGGWSGSSFLVYCCILFVAILSTNVFPLKIRSRCNCKTNSGNVTASASMCVMP
jgi:hypothetical protein